MHGGRSLMFLPRILRLAFSGLRTFFPKGRFSFKCPVLRTFFRRISAFRALQHPPGSSDSVEFAVRCLFWLHQSQVLQGCWSERLRCLNASSSACAAKAPPFKIQNMQNDNPVRKWSAIQGTECAGFDMSWIVLNCFWTPGKNYPTKASCAAQVPLKPIRRGFHLLEEPTWLRWSSKIKCWCHMICNKIGLLKQNVFEWTTELVRRS